MDGDSKMWEDFLDNLADVMERFERDPRFSLEDAIIKIESFENCVGIDSEIIEFAEAVLSEIGGAPNTFREVKGMATRSLTELLLQIR